MAKKKKDDDKKKKGGKKAKGDKKIAPKPKDMPWVSTYLTVADVKKSMELYEKAFGFEPRFTMPGPDGKPVHGEVAYQKMVVMMGTPCEKQGTITPAGGSFGGKAFGLYVYVDDVEALLKKVKRFRSVQIAMEPVDMFWGDRMFSCVDPDGHHWTFATRTKVVKPAEMEAAMAGQQQEE